QAGAVAAAAALAATAGEKSHVLLPLLLTPAPTEKTVLFARDSGRVRGWMKSALEDRHIDPQVVASATTLALRWLQRRHLYPSLVSSSPSAMKDTAVSNNAHRQRRRRQQPKQQQQQQQRRRRRRRSDGGGAGLPPLELLSMTCLHLASKYHTQDSVLVLEDFGSSIHRPEVHALGFDISLSMGAVLNASFRANAFSLQTLLCALSGESPVVKACSEWVSLCLVLLLHPYGEDNEHEKSPPRGEKVFSPALSAATAPLTAAPGGPTETPGASQAPSSSASTTATPYFTPAGASTTAAARQPQPTSATTGSTAAAGVWSSRNPYDGKSDVAPPAPHQQQQYGKTGDVRGRFSRATVLALASVVLARRLARARGPCLPPRVQATMGLGDGDALVLVSEGLRLARRAFATELCDDSQQQHPSPAAAAAAAAEGGLRGRDFLGGEVLLERKVEGPAASASSGSTTITRSLLEWLTESEDDRDAPEFAQGLPLSTLTVSSPRKKSPVPSGGVARDRAPSTGSDTASDRASSRGGKRARSPVCPNAREGSGVSGEEGGGPVARKRQRLGSPPGRPNCRDSGGVSPRSQAAGSGCAPQRAGSSSEEYVSAVEVLPSPPPSMETSPSPSPPPPRTPSQDTMDSDDATPRSPPSFSAGGVSFVSGDTTLSAGGRRPRGWGRVLFSAQSSNKVRREAAESPSRTRGPPAVPSASSPEERNARWEVLADRLLEALDDHHGGVVAGGSAGTDGHGGLSTAEGEGNGSSSSSSAAELAPILPDRSPLPHALAGDTVKSTPPGHTRFSPYTPPGPPPVSCDLGAGGAPGERGEEALTSSRVSSTADFDCGDCAAAAGGGSGASEDGTGGVRTASLATAVAAAGRGVRAQGLGVVAAGYTTLMSAVALAFRAASSSTAADTEAQAQEDWWW
ncbi:unnamed protein product, partial [Ectocarpus fasciculatus]